MKAGWETKSFEDCIEKVTYISKIQRKDFLDTGKYPIVSQEADFINGYWVNEDDIFKVSTPIVVFGDHTKVLKYIDFDFVLGADGVKVLKPRKFLFPKFFFYQLQTANLDSLGYARHYKLLKELNIVYPPLPEQQRIVNINPATLRNLVIEFVTRDWSELTDAGSSLESKIEQVLRQMKEGKVLIVFDLTTETCNLVPRESLPQHLKE